MGRFLTLDIEKMVYGGRGMGRLDGKVVFVPLTAPGDRAEIEVVREKKDYAEGVLKGIVRGSSLRVKPFCPLFGECGGCQYQHLSYGDQLKAKEDQVKDILHRLTRKGDLEVLATIPSPYDRGYRIRAQFKAGMSEGGKVLGFYAWRSHRVVEVRRCPLLFPLANEILHGLQSWFKNRKMVSIGGVDLQVSPDEGKGVVSLQIEGAGDPGIGEEIGKQVEGVKGVVLEGRHKSSWGESILRYNWPGIQGGRGLRIETGGESFFQINPYQNWNLMQKVVEWADLTGQEVVLDLFCGSGNLTLPLAQRAGKVWGIDQDSRAVYHAGENALANHLSNCAFLATSAGEGIRRVRDQVQKVDIAVLDPPRMGAREVLDLLVSLGPRKILYVSCDPPTLARDLARLMVLGYNVKRIQPLDMFPQTYHIEVITELAKAE